MNRILMSGLCFGMMVCLLPAEEGKKAVNVPDNDNGLARYKLTPGQELKYVYSSRLKYGEGKTQGEHGTKGEKTIWVLRANADGSYRLLIRDSSTFEQFRDGKAVQTDRAPTVEMVYADIFPDGRILPNPTILYRGSPDKIFPRLAKDPAEARNGWEAISGDTRTEARPAGDNKFTVNETSTFSKIYLTTNKQTYTFNPDKGLVTRADGESSQGYGFNGKGTGLTELTGDRMLSAADRSSLETDADRYFTIKARYDEATQSVGKMDPDKVKDALAKAVESVKSEGASISQPDLKKALEEQIKSHDSMINYHVQDAARRSKVVGKPAFTFKADDLEAKPFDLDRMRGKVVVLDFWYRGCGWCVKAMPQINEVVADFADKPVAILGMNTDQKKEDAEFVAREMALKYRTLLVKHEMAEKFGVQGFPTLVLIDKKGVVRDLHVGYSPKLREEVGKMIRELLAE